MKQLFIIITLCVTICGFLLITYPQAQEIIMFGNQDEKSTVYYAVIAAPKLLSKLTSDESSTIRVFFGKNTPLKEVRVIEANIYPHKMIIETEVGTFTRTKDRDYLFRPTNSGMYYCKIPHLLKERYILLVGYHLE